MAPQAQITDLYIVSSLSKQAGSSFLFDLPVQISAGSYPIKESPIGVRSQKAGTFRKEISEKKSFV